jgi:D-xylonolactonase
MRNGPHQAPEQSTPARLAADSRCRLGEQPLWDVIHQQLVWTDIDGGRLYRFDSRIGEWSAFYDGPPVGGITLQEDGSLLVFRVDDVCRIFSDGTIQPVVTAIDASILRFNDAIADPEGRVFVGSRSPAGRRSAGVFRLNTNGRLDRVLSGTATANGMAFSPDLRTFYWTDTTARTIFAFDYDRRTGHLTDGRELIVIAPGQGVPDALFPAR